ncbi:murein biosynthesis integral membrane protein MurJ [Dictyobacter kobayashii]|uniref:Putative lipid II flippase MurJ n=1 Tax=Dictyobacter kobayashii TaxID=2014872 RepID=A0A402AFS0_9CHLR|nr:oligosaccharide flippase family protein [Dictyobacter kobayashii]GCE17970.1 putative lipid II flippase MurJ [Dictyobacter kobayashii]
MAKDSINNEEILSSENNHDDDAVEAVPTVLGGGNIDSEAAVEIIETTTAKAKDDTSVSSTAESASSEVQEEVVAPADSAIRSERRELVKSASLVALGNLGSSVLGMLRQSFIAYTGPGISGPFFASLSPAQKFNDFIVNGSVPGALIPTFNDYAENKEALRRLVFTLVNLVLIIMTISSVGYFFVAPWFTNTILAPGFNPQEKLLTLQFTRIVFFSLLALGPFAVLQAALYAQKEFGWTAFAAAAYHAGIIVGAIFTGMVGKQFFGLGQYGLPLGVIIGTVGEILLLIPGMRNQGMRYMFVLDFNHPALRRILKLYAPIAFSFFFSACVAFLDQFLATQTPCIEIMRQQKSCGDANLSAMAFATLLIQFPGGLVASALSFAVLPTLTTHMREGDLERFKSTLLLGFRLGLLLMIPAAAGLIVLKLPIVTLLFQRGKFSPAQAVLTSMALQNFSYQLPFIAIDQLLISAFYARKNTIIPVAVLVLSVFGYLAVALPFWHTIGMPALAFANSVQNTLHPLILLLILWKTIGSLHLRGVVPALLKILLATAVMVAVAWGLQLALAHIHLFSLSTFIGSALTVIVAGGIAAAIYFILVIAFKVEEVSMLKGAVLAKLGKK